MPKLRWRSIPKILCSEAGLSHEDLVVLKKAIRKLLESPEHQVGLQSYRGNEQAWSEWLGRVIDGRIIEHFWGADKGRKWDVTKDRDIIGKFVGRVVTKVAHEMRARLRKKARRLNDQQLEKHKGRDSITVKQSAKEKYIANPDESNAIEDEEIMELVPSTRLSINNIARNYTFLRSTYVTHFDKSEWFLFYRFISARLIEPENHIGLWEFGKDKEGWERWFDSFLAIVVEKDYWKGEKQRIWTLTSDNPDILRWIMMDIVIKAASFTRRRLNKGLPVWELQHRTDSNSDQSSNSGNDVSDSDSGLTSLTLGKEKILHTDDDDTILRNRSASSDRNFPRFRGSEISQTFMTHITSRTSDNSNVQYETIKLNTIIPLSIFLDLVRDTHKIQPSTGIKSLEVEVCGRKIDIDLYDPEAEWSWGLVLGILNYSGIEDGEVAYVAVHVELYN